MSAASYDYRELRDDIDGLGLEVEHLAQVISDRTVIQIHRLPWWLDAIRVLCATAGFVWMLAVLLIVMRLTGVTVLLEPSPGSGLVNHVRTACEVRT